MSSGGGSVLGVKDLWLDCDPDVQIVQNGMGGGMYVGRLRNRMRAPNVQVTPYTPPTPRLKSAAAWKNPKQPPLPAPLPALPPAWPRNQSLEKVTANAHKTLFMIGLDGQIPVVRGQARSLLRPHVACPEIHGDTGLDGTTFDFPPPPAPQPPGVEQPGVVRMMAGIRASLAEKGGGPVRLVATGALTNVALLFTLYPEAVGMVEVVLMGGAMGVGNTGAVAEYNIQNDPEAAKIVFDSGAPVVMVPLEVTHTALCTGPVLARILGDGGGGGGGGSRFRRMIVDLLLFFKESYKATFDFEDPPLHDPCAVAYVIDPKHLRVDIETASPLSYGQTVCDVWRQSGRAPNAIVATRMDVGRFWDLMVASVDEADRASPLNR